MMLLRNIGMMKNMNRSMKKKIQRLKTSCATIKISKIKLSL